MGTARVPRGASDFNDELKTIHFSLNKYAGVAELADAPDLGSGGTPVQVQVLSPAPKIDRFRPVDFLSIAKAMVYHHAQACISSPKVYIISRRLHFFSQ